MYLITKTKFLGEHINPEISILGYIESKRKAVAYLKQFGNVKVNTGSKNEWEIIESGELYGELYQATKLKKL